MELIDLEIPVKEGSKTIKAIKVSELWAVNWDQEKGDARYSLSHIPTGYALSTGYYKAEYALVVASRFSQTLSAAQKEMWSADTYEALSKLPKHHTNAVRKYLQAARRCENNTETERLVGRFWRDREDTERLRLKINPEANTLLDESAIGSEKLTMSLMAGEFVLAE